MRRQYQNKTKEMKRQNAKGWALLKSQNAITFGMGSYTLRSSSQVIVGPSKSYFAFFFSPLLDWGPSRPHDLQ